MDYGNYAVLPTSQRIVAIVGLPNLRITTFPQIMQLYKNSAYATMNMYR